MANPGEPRTAVVLLSGGLDSATTAAVALRDGFDCYALTVDYGQRHACEVDAAMDVCASLGIDQHHVVRVPALAELASSALTEASQAVPRGRTVEEVSADRYPPTYVPARNTVLLGLALATAESIGARDLFVGFSRPDAAGYPDCRPDFVRAFQTLADVATRPGLPWTVHAPLIAMSKAEVVRLGHQLGVDYARTHSCYDPSADCSPTNPEAPPWSARWRWRACGRCDACVLRRAGFEEAGVPDPTSYVPR